LKSPTCKTEFIRNRAAEKVLDISIKSFQLDHLKNLHLSAGILLCECGIGEFAEAIKAREEELLSMQDKAESEGMRVAFKERINRFNEWLAQARSI